MLACGNFDVLKPDVLAILCCPEDHSKLTPASSALLADINGAIRRRQVRNRGGQLIEREIDGGLVKSGGDVVYPIIDGIPVLVRDEAIEVDQPSGGRDGA
jgi:uncharacterized protein YbaR (Trm112 family)